MEIDLADSLDDLICTFDKAVSGGSSDILVAISWWLVIAGAIFLAVGYIVINLRASLATDTQDSTVDSPASGYLVDTDLEDESNKTGTHCVKEDLNCEKSVSSYDKVEKETLTNILENEATRSSTSNTENQKTAPKFAALDPPGFYRQQEKKNGSSLPIRNDILSSDREKSSDGSDPNQNVLINGQHSPTYNVRLGRYTISFNVF